MKPKFNSAFPVTSFRSLAFKPWARRSILNTLSAVTVASKSVLRASMSIEGNHIVKRIIRNCFALNVPCASGRLVAGSDGWKLWENLGMLLALSVR